MIPYSTDAPIYHWPIATVGLIVLNILMFIAAAGYESEASMVLVDDKGREISEAELERLLEQAEKNDGLDEDDVWNNLHVVPSSSGGSLLLQYGAGLKPWQWVTSIFMHAGIGHLLGNMIFLWAFGIIVEGKVGWLPFLLLYLAIGCGQSALEQLIMLGASGGASLGASAAIFGLLGVAMMWAPRNDFECLWSYGTFEIPILAFAGLKFLLEAVGVLFQGFAMSSSLLHLMGAVFGLSLGGLWIKRGWVDCEGYDLFSVMAGTEGRRAENEQLEREATGLLAGTYRARTAAEPRPAITPQSFPPAIPFGAIPASPPAAVGGPRPAASLGSSASPPDIDSLDDLFGPGPAIAAEESLKLRIGRLDEAFQEDRFAEVPELRQHVRQLDSDYEIPQAALLRWIENLLANKQYVSVVPLMNQHVRRFDHKRPAMQVQLAKILLHLKQPQQALKVLQRIDMARVSASGKATINQLIARASTVTK